MRVIADTVDNRYNITEDVPHFGLEIEVENCLTEPDPAGTGWAWVSDGSLRHGGLEFLSRRPRSRRSVRRDIDAFYGWKENSSWTTGVRTSTHVHVNVLGHTVGQVAAAATAYTLVEPILYRYCGPVREENIYCVPWYRAPDELSNVHMAARTDSISPFLSTCKYSGLYLEPVARFGTMEFRQAPVFNTSEQLWNWVCILERLVYSGFNTPDDVLECFKELGAEQFVKGLFGETLAGILREYCDLPFEDLLEKYDTETTAEMASASTYQLKPSDWVVLQFGIEGDGARNYHQFAPQLQHRMYFQDPEFYVDEEMEEEYEPDYYGDEEDY